MSEQEPLRNDSVSIQNARVGPSIAIVAFAFVVLVLWMLWLPTTALASWQRRHFHWNYGFQALFFVIPLAILLTGRRSATDYGLCLTKPAFHLRFLLMLAATLVLVPIAAESMWGQLALNRTFSSHVISTLVFHFVFSSFGEELFFRGFAQGELNRGLGRPWRLGVVQFGPGLLVTTLVFALGHVQGYHHSLGSSVVAFALTGCFAFFAGLLREYTNGIWAPFVLHASIDFNAHVFQSGTMLLLTGFLCTGFAFWVIMGLLRRSPIALKLLTNGKVATEEPAAPVVRERETLP